MAAGRSVNSRQEEVSNRTAAEYDAILATTHDLERTNAGGIIPVDAARRRAAHLLTVLRAHRAEQVDLILEAFERDIGALD